MFDDQAEWMDDEMEEGSACSSGCSSCAGCSGCGEPGEPIRFQKPPSEATLLFLHPESDRSDYGIKLAALLNSVLAEITPVLSMTGIQLKTDEVPVSNPETVLHYRIERLQEIRVNNQAIPPVSVERSDARAELANGILEKIFGVHSAEGEADLAESKMPFPLPDVWKAYFSQPESHD